MKTGGLACAEAASVCRGRSQHVFTRWLPPPLSSSVSMCRGQHVQRAAGGDQQVPSGGSHHGEAGGSHHGEAMYRAEQATMCRPEEPKP